MKKNLSILAAIAISLAALSLVSCGSTPKNDKQVQETDSAKKENSQNTQIDETENPAPVSGQELLVDDFEEGMFFEAVGSSWNDGDVSVSCILSTDWGTEGGTSLKCTVGTKGAEWEKGGFFTTPYETDWTGMTMVSIDVKNPNDFDLGLCLVLQDGENWEEWNQFENQTVEANSETTLTFVIPSKKYLSCIQRLLVYTWGAVPNECSFYVDNIVAKN